MYHNFPYFRNNGELVLFRYHEQMKLPDEYLALCSDILKAFQLINAARTLHIPPINKFIDPGIDTILKNKISNLLEEASHKTDNEQLRLMLSERANAFLNQKFNDAALASAKHMNLPIELMVGFLPSWRYEKKPKTYSGLLALPDKADSFLIDNTDKIAIEVIKELCKNLDVTVIAPSATLPKQITCDVIALAGDLATHPIHIAHFLPEDEGNYDTQTFKTLIYRNLYLSRYKEITQPLSIHCYKIDVLNKYENDKTLWSVLSNWFRGHDIGHVYFDQHCKQLPGVNRRKRYALQEACADLFGYFLTTKVLDESSNVPVSNATITSIYLSEMLRYMTRDIEIFPDAKSAWFQFGYLLKEGALKINEEGVLEANIELVSKKLYELFADSLIKIFNKETAFMESILDSFSKINDIKFVNYLQNSKARKETDPIFSIADSILENENPNVSEAGLRIPNTPDEYDGRLRF